MKLEIQQEKSASDEQYLYADKTENMEILFASLEETRLSEVLLATFSHSRLLTEVS